MDKAVIATKQGCIIVNNHACLWFISRKLGVHIGGHEGGKNH